MDKGSSEFTAARLDGIRQILRVRCRYNNGPLEQIVSGPIQIHSRIGEDGVLNLSVPMGASDANTEVMITIAPANGNGTRSGRLEWHEFVRQTYGSCAGFGLDEPPDLPLQERNSDQ